MKKRQNLGMKLTGALIGTVAGLAAAALVYAVGEGGGAPWVGLVISAWVSGCVGVWAYASMRNSAKSDDVNRWMEGRRCDGE